MSTSNFTNPFASSVTVEERVRKLPQMKISEMIVAIDATPGLQPSVMKKILYKLRSEELRVDMEPGLDPCDLRAAIERLERKLQNVQKPVKPKKLVVTITETPGKTMNVHMEFSPDLDADERSGRAWAAGVIMNALADKGDVKNLEVG